MNTLAFAAGLDDITSINDKTVLENLAQGSETALVAVYLSKATIGFISSYKGLQEMMNSGINAEKGIAYIVDKCGTIQSFKDAMAAAKSDIENAQVKAKEKIAADKKTATAAKTKTTKATKTKKK